MLAVVTPLNTAPIDLMGAASRTFIGGIMKPTYEEVAEALGKAIEVYRYASMTSYEREACAEDMEFAEDILKRVGEP